MAKMISFLKNKDNIPFANGGLKLSKNILISKVETYPKFQELFPIDSSVLERITKT